MRRIRRLIALLAGVAVMACSPQDAPKQAVSDPINSVKPITVTAQTSISDLEKLVTDGNADATFELAKRYILGTGVAADRKKSLEVLARVQPSSDSRLIRLKKSLLEALDPTSRFTEIQGCRSKDW